MEKKFDTIKFDNNNVSKALPIIKKALADGLKTIAFDFEFPGIYITSKCQPQHIKPFYEYTRKNVDLLNPIQLGLTFFNATDPHNSNYVTLEFEMRFDMEKDTHTKGSIKILTEAGLDFERHKYHGIKINDLRRYLESTELFSDKDIMWVIFHGNFDLGYFLKILTNKKLPQNIEEFNAVKKTYFPCIYDIKMILINNRLVSKWSLSAIGTYFKIPMDGEVHQAGFDSKLTAKIFSLLHKKLEFEVTKSLHIGRVYGLSDKATKVKIEKLLKEHGFETEAELIYTKEELTVWYENM